MTPEDRASAMKIDFTKPGHIADEVIVTAARMAQRESWPDRRNYQAALNDRLYRHVRAHVLNNPGWQSRGGGEDATSKDCAQYVLLKLIEDEDSIIHAEVAFGDFVYKRSLDFADTLYTKKNSGEQLVTDESDFNEFEAYEPDSSPSASVLEQLLAREDEEARQRKLDRIRELVNEEGLLTEKERMAFTFHYFGGIQAYSKDPTKVSVSKLMNLGESSVRKYLKRAEDKIKEKLI